MELIAEFETLDERQLNDKIQQAADSFKSWKRKPMEDRGKLIHRVAANLESNRDELATTITQEMGKPIAQARAEVEKCAWVCKFYADNAAEFLEKEDIKTDGQESWVEYQPLGPVLAIMPWNYPLWQVFRFAAPAIMAGNSCLLKHASNVSQCAINIEKLFAQADAPDALFQTLLISSSQVKSVIENPEVKAVTLTGSEKAGASVASTAGKEIKKTVLELGGSNAFVVLDDADLDSIIDDAVDGRFQNTGQSCIAAKRFLIVESIYQDFMKRFSRRVKSLKQGDPFSASTEIGPMARVDLAEELEKQMQESLDLGARLLTGGNRKRAMLEPTILEDVKPNMPAFDQELFGPIAAITRVSGPEDALDLINHSKYGLGATVCTRDKKLIRYFIDEIEDGAVFINSMVKSDPRLPFGGTKFSGYGRELSHHGIREFVNIKTVYLK